MKDTRGRVKKDPASEFIIYNLLFTIPLVPPRRVTRHCFTGHSSFSSPARMA
jgi:hypothetical protein